MHVLGEEIVRLAEALYNADRLNANLPICYVLERSVTVAVELVDHEYDECDSTRFGFMAASLEGGRSDYCVVLGVDIEGLRGLEAASSELSFE